MRLSRQSRLTGIDSVVVELGCVHAELVPTAIASNIFIILMSAPGNNQGTHRHLAKRMVVGNRRRLNDVVLHVF